MLPPAYNPCDTLMVPSNPASLGVNAEVGTVAKTQNTGELYYKYGRSATQWVQVSGTTGALMVPTNHASRHKTGGADVLAVDGTISTEGTDSTATTATMAASRRNGMMIVAAPEAAAVDEIVAAVLPVDGPIAFTVHPDWPRKLQVDIIDADASISAGTITLAGLDQNGASVSETFPLTGGTQNVKTAKAFASLTSITVAGCVGAVAPDTVSVGVTNDLGLVSQQIPAASGYAVYLEYLNGVLNPVGTVDSVAGTIAPTVAPNAFNTYRFFFTYSVTELQNSHAHVHSHTHALHTHTIS